MFGRSFRQLVVKFNNGLTILIMAGILVLLQFEIKHALRRALFHIHARYYTCLSLKNCRLRY